MCENFRQVLKSQIEAELEKTKWKADMRHSGLFRKF